MLGVSGVQKNRSSGLQMFHTQSNSEINEGAHDDVVIILHNRSTTIIFKGEIMF